MLYLKWRMQRIGRIFISLGLVITLAFLSLFWLCMPMMSMGDGIGMAQTHICQDLPMEPVCHMTISQHINFWQQIAVLTPASWSVLLTVTFLAAALYFVGYGEDYKDRRLRFIFYRLVHSYDIFRTDYLKRYLAQGILQPKVY